jgi:hypothetical protein
MKIHSMHDEKSIITYWNNKWIVRDTVSKVNAMYIEKAVEINIIYFNKNAIDEAHSQDL